MEFLDLTSLLEQHFPVYSPIIKASAVHYDLIKDIHTCDRCWSELIRSISSTSAACGILHPSSRSSQLISSMLSKDITDDLGTMKILQEEIPIVFELIRSLGYYPKDILSPFLNELLVKANKPFPNDDMASCTTVTTADLTDSEDLAYFPMLPKVRTRGHYRADKNTSGPVCKKRRLAHPSLLPGVFTLFCQHGNFYTSCIYIKNYIILRCILPMFYTGICYGFKVMRFAESPDVPFTVIYERFPTGY